MPLSSKDVQFSCNNAEFDGNELIIPEDFKPEKVNVKAVLKTNPSVSVEKTIWIRKMPYPDLPTKDEMLNGKKKGKNKD